MLYNTDYIAFEKKTPETALELATLVILYVRDVSLTERMPDAIWY